MINIQRRVGFYAAVVAMGGLLRVGLASAQIFEGMDGIGLSGCRAAVVGSVCVDRYEASVWSIPNLSPAGRSNAAVVKRIRKGTVTLAELQGAGATPFFQNVQGPVLQPCSEDGEDCRGAIFAVSIAGVAPAVRISWQQAQQACANAGGRLPSNAEWQAATVGTPDNDLDNGTTSCNVSQPGGPMPAITATGARSGCVSSYGVHDTIGNVGEWVADWVVDLANPANLRGMVRGGDFRTGAAAGTTHITVTNGICGGADDDQLVSGAIGFRCVR